MKKVININFQGRVIPIEETAYEMLQNYIGTLRSYFANEEGRDEIINDIENRIGELFDDKLKKGAACIMDADVDNIMNSMGRPEDFDRDEEPSRPAGEKTYQSASPAYEEPAYSKKRLFRDEEDKILGGVASGLAHYLNIDPAVMRILFAVLVLAGGSGFLIYIILWIVLPSRSLVTNIRKRLYRDTEDRVISGVCGGLGKYFDINPAVPRIIFAAPFIFGIITSIGRSFFDPGSVFAGSFGGGTFILVYIILWIVLPEAITTSEKLEMRGEKIDLNSIRNTVMGDMQGVKGRAQKMGEEIKESAQRFASEAKESFGTGASNIASDTSRAVRRSGRGLGHAIAVIIKAFVYFIGGIIALSLFVGLIVLLGSGVSVLPLRDFLLQGTAQNMFAWGTILLFIGIPIISLIVWFIRRLMRVETSNRYLGYSFGVLWFAGLFCLIGLISSLSRSFSSQVGKREDITITQPASKMVVSIGKTNINYVDSWVELEGIISLDRDSLYLNTARVNVIRSNDSLYHVHLVKISRGANRQQSQQLAEHINFPVTQTDNTIYLPESFTVTKDQKWRNQRVLVVIEVPLGKQIRIDDHINDYDYFNIEFGRSRNWRNNFDFDREWEDGMYWNANKDMTMTKDGLKWDEEKEDEDREEGNMKVDTTVIPAPPGNPALPAPPKPGEKKTDSVYRYNGQVLSQPGDDEDAEPQEASSGRSNGLNISNSMNLASPLAVIFRL
jgi:phage shock protein PspC (stress-responsive transcriptional regulator)